MPRRARSSRGREAAEDAFGVSAQWVGGAWEQGKTFFSRGILELSELDLSRATLNNDPLKG